VKREQWSVHKKSVMQHRVLEYSERLVSSALKYPKPVRLERILEPTEQKGW
jgi:hypothetical protein